MLMLPSTKKWLLFCSEDFPTVRTTLLKTDLAALETALHLLIIRFSSEDADTQMSSSLPKSQLNPRLLTLGHLYFSMKAWNHTD